MMLKKKKKKSTDNDILKFFLQKNKYDKILENSLDNPNQILRYLNYILKPVSDKKSPKIIG